MTNESNLNEEILEAFFEVGTNSANFIKIKGLKRDEPTHYFEINNQKIPSGGFKGNLIDIKPSEYEYEGLTRKTIKMIFTTKTQKYILDTAYTGISRSIINTLLGYIDSQKKIGKNNGNIILELSLYINKDGYKQVGIKINGDRASWKYGIEEQKKLIKVETKRDGRKERDFYDYDLLLEEGLQEIQKFIECNGTEEIDETLKVDENISIEDIPF